jgi:hypothetical protein
MRIPSKLQPWFDARRRLGLSHATVQMARELGMNPKKLDKLVPAAGQAWKASLAEFVAHCYEKSHGRRLPEKVCSLEELVKNEAQRKEARRATRAARLQAEQPPAAAPSSAAVQETQPHCGVST